jgi:hypothetical protein
MRKVTLLNGGFDITYISIIEKDSD